MALSNLRIEDVIKPEFREEYHRLHKDICDRIDQVNTNIQILETISKYPLYLLNTPSDNIFWNLVYWNFLYISILFIHGLTNDQGRDVLTLPNFKSQLMKLWTKDEMVSRIKEHLRTSHFDKRLKTLSPVIKQMRLNIIAHRIFDRSDASLPEIPGISITELRSSFNTLEELFGIISFGIPYKTTLYIDSTYQGRPVKKDIEQILDFIVKTSSWLNLPESNPSGWSAKKKYMSPEERDELNSWRKKFDLPEI